MSPVTVPVPVSQAGQAYRYLSAPKNTMFSGQETQGAEERVNKRVPMIPEEQLSARMAETGVLQSI